MDKIAYAFVEFRIVFVSDADGNLEKECVFHSLGRFCRLCNSNISTNIERVHKSNEEEK